MAGVLAFAPAANATDFFFSQSGGNWSDPTKWTTAGGPAGVPTAGDNAEFGGNNLTYTVTTSGNAIQNVMVNTSDVTFNLGGNLTISSGLSAAVHGFIRATGSGTLSAGSMAVDQLTISSGTTVTTSSFSSLNVISTGGIFNTGNFQHGSAQFSQGSTVTSTSVTLDNGFGASTLDASSWKVTGLFQSNNAYTLTIKNGGTLTSGSALTSQSGGVLVDGAGSSWKITNDANIRSTSGLNGGMEVEHGGVVTVGGNLFVANGGAVYGNYSSTTGASEIDVTGRVDLSSAGSIYLGQGATLTSAGVVTRATPFDGGSIPNGASLDISGTWTNTGGFIVGESGQNTASAANSLAVRSGGMVTTSADLIVGQGAAFNTLLVGNGGTVKNVNGVLAQNAGSQTTADVTGTWTNSGTLTVADAGTAILRIGNSAPLGGTVSNTAATVGNQANSNGSVDIQGAGKWTVNGNLVVGAAGMSTGKVSAGFGGTLTVTSPTITLGRDAGSTGTLSLDDAFGHGTLFNFTGEIQVGLAGSGTLEILDGFRLDHGAKSLTLGGQATAEGTLRVSDDYAQFGFPAATQTLYKSTNLTIGSLGQGAVDIEHNGFVLTTGDAVLGEMAGGSGIASIAGTGSKWQVDGSLVVGKSGSASAPATGQVIVKDGGTLTVNGPLVTLGQETGSKGTLTIDGVGSIFSNPSKLEIGRHGEGTLEVKNGASIILPSTTLGTQADGRGTITVDGKGANNGPASSVTTSGSLTIGGVSGSNSVAGGTLNITGGGQMTIDGGEAIVARDAGSIGAVHLAGQGSQWLINAPGGSINGPTPGNLTIGQGGLGHVDITDHATLTTAALVLARDANGFGTLDLTGSSGANDARLTVNGELQAGVGGYARATVSAGARLAITDKLLVATGSGSTGEVHFQGTGTTAMIGNQLTVGKGGLGSITVESGATLTTRFGYIGALNLGGTGSGSLTIDGAGGASGAQFETLNISNPVGALSGSGVRVTGTGAQLTATVVLNVGTGFGSSPGTGQLVLGPGGTLNAIEVDVASYVGTSFITIGGDAAKAATLNTPQLNIGGVNGGQATVTVDAGGRIDASAVGQTVRVKQSGQLTVEGSEAKVLAHDLLIDGGSFMLINNASAEVGSTFSVSGGGSGGGSGAGSATVADSGRLTVFGSAIVAGGAAFSVHDSGQVAITYELRISNGGTVSVFHNGTMTQTDIQVGSASSGSGTLTAVDGGHLDANALSIGGGSVVSVSGGGNIYLGSMQAQAAAGTVTVAAGGALTNNGTINGIVIAQAGGTIGGAGTINGTVILGNGGVLAPGNSPGTMTVGSLTVGSGSILNYQLGTPGVVGGGVNDLTIVNGALTLSGGTLNIADAGGFGAGTYRLFDYTGMLTGSALTFGTLPTGFTAADLTLQTSVPNQINLIVTNGTPSVVQYWNGPNTIATAGVLGGTGTWNNVLTNWTNSTGSGNTAWQQAVAIFSAGTGTATLGANITATELQFQAGSGAYTVATGINTLTISGAGITNTSGITQNFVTDVNGAGGRGIAEFRNAATAGSNTAFTNSGGTINGALGGLTRFLDTSTAGSGTVTNNGGTVSGANGGILSFQNSATAGTGTFTTNGGTVFGAFGGTAEFRDTSTAGSGIFTTNGSGGVASVVGGGRTQFFNNSTAANGTFTNNASTVTGSESGSTQFFNNSTAGSGIFINNGGETRFSNTSTAGNGSFTNNGATVSGGGSGLTDFLDSSTAGTGTFTTNAGTANGTIGGITQFNGSSTAGGGTFINNGGAFSGGAPALTIFNATSNAGAATITNNGGTAAGSFGGVTTFRETASANSAMLIANAGTNGGDGGAIQFFDDATGGTATVKVFGNGRLDIGFHNAPGVTTGSIEGSGIVYLGANNMTVSGNNLSTTFSGVIRDGRPPGSTNETATGGSFTKTGPGTLTLSGINTYTGPTIVSAGKLLVNGSLAGVSAVSVSGGATLGGGGTVGPVTFANNGILSPGNSPGTLTTGTLLFNNLSQLNFELGTPNVIGGGINDLMIVNGNLTLDGVLNISDTGGFGTGTYRLFNYTGALTDNALSFGMLPGGFTAANLMIQTSVANQINLIVNGGVVLPGQFWNGGNTTATAGVLGGTGTWNITTTNWTDATGASPTNWKQGAATFIAGAGTATLGENIIATELRFQAGSGAYTVATGANTLTITGAGITNSSGITQNFATGAVGEGTAGTITFTNSATAGSNTTFTNSGGRFNNLLGGLTRFQNTATAGTGTFTNNGGTASGALGGSTEFYGNATAANATFTANGGTVGGAKGGLVAFNANSTAGNGTFTANGGTASGAFGGLILFGSVSESNDSTAGSATLIANGGTIGGEGGSIQFQGISTGGPAVTVKVFGNGNLDISRHFSPPVIIGSLEGTGNVFLGAGILTVGGNNSSTTFSGAIQDGGIRNDAGGSLIKVGTGTLMLTGKNTYTGFTDIQGGTLAVNGSLASADTFIRPGATLTGTGSVMGQVTNYGTVSPGNSPGTLTIVGNYTQLSTGTLRIAVAGAQPGQFSVLAVGGKATLDGTLQVVKENGATLKAGDRLKIVTAVGGVSGVFSATVNPFATGSMLGIQVIYESNAVVLAFVQNSFVQLATLTGQTPNQIAVARTLDGILSDPRAAQVIAFLNGEPLGNIPGDLDKLGPADLTSIFHIAKSLANIQSANVLRRTEEIRSEAEGGGVEAGSINGTGGGARGPTGRRSREIAPAEDRRWGMFFSGSGEFTHVGSTTNAAGFDLDSGGVTAGVDYRFTDKFAAGISLGYMNTTASLANGGKIDVDGGRVGAYATYFDRGLHLAAAVSGGPNSYATRRTMPNNTVATGSPEGSEVNLTFAAGYDWKFRGITVGPTASFQYTNVQLDGFTERGTFAPLSVVKKNADSARSALGVRATFDTKMGRAILRHEVRASWQHEFGDTSYSLTSTFATLGGSAFSVAGPETGRDSLLIGAGFSILWNERFSIYAYYDGELGRANYDSHNVSAGCRLRF